MADEEKTTTPEEQAPAADKPKTAEASENATASPEQKPETEAQPTSETSEAEKPADTPVEAETAPAEPEAEADAPAEDASDEPAEAEALPHMDVQPGMTIRLHERIRDVSPKGEERERIQVFEGMVLRVKGEGNQRTLTIRKVSKGFGVEKVFPLSSPNIANIEVLKTAKVRRANLGYLRRGFKRKLKEIRAE